MSIQKLIGILHQELGLQLLDVTIGNPYVNPHVNRPADWQIAQPPGGFVWEWEYR